MASELSQELLVVDDSLIYRKLVEQILVGHPYAPLFASSGAEALCIVQEKAPRIVVTDWMMPDISGIELCQRIRADKALPYTYVILMTSNREKDSLVKGLQAGADDYLAKPFDAGEMLARIGVGRRIIELQRELEEKNTRLEEVARTDSLTGLPNRRAIEEWADKQLKGSSRHRFPIWVAVGDLDCFKQVNDTYGHEAGDRVLRTFAEILKKATRACDMCGRLGGDEFLLVITHVSAKNVEMTVNRFREQFAALSFAFGGRNLQVSSTFGVAGSESGGPESFERLVREADEMLYQAKREGRNRVKLSARR
jgi:two-component system, cell cycle response regulator